MRLVCSGVGIVQVLGIREGFLFRGNEKDKKGEEVVAKVDSLSAFATTFLLCAGVSK